MNVALQKRMTVDEFLAWEERQEDRWEFDGVQPIAMVGGTRAHSLVLGNLATALNPRLRGSPCRVLLKSVKIRSAGSFRYPDVFVKCGRQDNQATISENPVVVFEVQSPSTSSIDLNDKNAEYRATPSIQRYVMLAQDRIAATVFERRGDEWVGSLVIGDDAMLHMPEICITFPLFECYEGVIQPA